MDKQKGISKLAYAMAVLSVIAILLGVSVFYWLVLDTTVASSGGAKRLISEFSVEHR